MLPSQPPMHALRFPSRPLPLTLLSSWFLMARHGGKTVAHPPLSPQVVFSALLAAASGGVQILFPTQFKKGEQ